MERDDEFKQKFLGSLAAGELETVTFETHPFMAAGVDDLAMCDRCGEHVADERMLWRLVALMIEGKDEARVSPCVLKECPTCSEVEHRFHAARYASAAA